VVVSADRRAVGPVARLVVASAVRRRADRVVVRVVLVDQVAVAAVRRSSAGAAAGVAGTARSCSRNS
jgi:hypothetical protein